MDSLPSVIRTPEPELLRPGRLWKAMWKDLLASRGLAWRLATRNISAMYRRTALGYVWAFLPPILAALTFIFLRKGGAMETLETHIPYVPWVVIGTFLWQAFADALNNPIRQVSQGKAMLIKINFPREALILAGFGETLFNFTIRLIILVPVLIYFGVGPNLQDIPFFVLSLFTLLIMGSMFGLLLTPISVLYQDIEKSIPLFLPFLMILSGAVTPLPHHGLSQWVARLNPIYPVLQTSRDLLSGQPANLWLPTIIIGVVSFALLFVGWVLYRLAMPHLIARIGN